MGRTKIRFLMVMAGLITSIGLVTCLAVVSRAEDTPVIVSATADIKTLTVELKNPKTAMRLEAIRKLSRIRSRESAEVLSAHFAVEQDPYVKRKMIKSMSVNQTTGTVKAVLSALGDPNPKVRQTAATELGYYDVNNKEIVDGLSNALKNESNKGVAIGIVNTLGSSKEPEAVNTIEKTLIHKDKDIKKMAVKALGAIGTKKAIGVLEKNKNNPNDREMRDNVRQELKISKEKSAKDNKRTK